MLSLKSKKLILFLGITGVLVATSVGVYAATASTSTVNMTAGETRNMNAAVTVQNNIKIMLNGQQVAIKDQIINQNGSVLLPMREISNLLGASVDYDSTNKVAIIDSADTHVEIPLGYSFLSINGQKTQIANNAKSIVYNSKTYLPVRAVAQSLKASINYDGPSKTIIITTNGQTPTTPTTPTTTPTVTPTPTSQPTAAPTTNAKNSPQYIFDNNLKMSTVDDSYKKSFTSAAQVKQLLPDRVDKEIEYILPNMNYVEVNLAVTKHINPIEGTRCLSFSKNDATISGGVSNAVVVFKDGTYTTEMVGDLPNGKTPKDVSYMAYSTGNTYVIVHITSVDMSAFKY